MNDLLNPSQVLKQMADALPPEHRADVIVIGSLAAGFRFMAGSTTDAVRTKDIDCMLSPHAKAVTAAKALTEELLRSNWTMRRDPQWGEPGDAATAVENLPIVRLCPQPEQEGAEPQWFLELLGAPDDGQSADGAKRLERVITSHGHFAICSFDYLRLVEWMPYDTPYGVRIARPEMMALANLLHHPTIGSQTMSGNQFGEGVKRANKDLGRVVALAYLQRQKDIAEDGDDLFAWTLRMSGELESRFPAEARQLAVRAASGLEALLSSEPDLHQALRTCNLGLLAGRDMGPREFEAVAMMFLDEVLLPLRSWGQSGR